MPEHLHIADEKAKGGRLRAWLAMCVSLSFSSSPVSIYDMYHFLLIAHFLRLLFFFFLLFLSSSTFWSSLFSSSFSPTKPGSSRVLALIIPHFSYVRYFVVNFHPFPRRTCTTSRQFICGLSLFPAIPGTTTRQTKPVLPFSWALNLFVVLRANGQRSSPLTHSHRLFVSFGFSSSLFLLPTGTTPAPQQVQAHPVNSPNWRLIALPSCFVPFHFVGSLKS